MTTARSAQIALDTAERLLPVDSVLTGLAAQDRGSLAGLAGTALLHARLAAVDDRFTQGALVHWKQAAAHARRSPGGRRPAGIFYGPGALATSLILGSPYLPDPEEQHESTARATQWLSARACVVADEQRDRLRSGALTTPWTVYDTINGLAGIGRVLLAGVVLGHTGAQEGLMAALSALTAMIGEPGQRRPGWWRPADQHPSETSVDLSGAAATGLAHGIAGPLSLLAVAHSSGHSVAGQPEAIRHAARWLLHWKEPGPAHTWPPRLTGDELDSDIAAPQPGRRDAWCYGTPGISRALILAAHALAEEEFRIVAQRALEALACRPQKTWDIEGPSLCHGYAGILQGATDCPSLANQAAAAVTAMFNPRHRYGFQHVHHNVPADDPGLLTGASGIALALADHGDLPASATSTNWDSVLLLS